MPYDQPLDDTWNDRDLPVLRAVVEACDQTAGQAVKAIRIQDATGLSDEDIQRAGVALVEGGLIEREGALGRPVLYLKRPTAEARRLAGTWPTPDGAADRMMAALEQIAENGDTADVRSRARKALDAFKGAGQQVAVGVATAVIKGAVT